MSTQVTIVPLRNTTHHLCTVELLGTTKTTAAMAPTSSVMIVEDGDTKPNVVGITSYDDSDADTSFLEHTIKGFHSIRT